MHVGLVGREAVVDALDDIRLPYVELELVVVVGVLHDALGVKAAAAASILSMAGRRTFLCSAAWLTRFSQLSYLPSSITLNWLLKTPLSEMDGLSAHPKTPNTCTEQRKLSIDLASGG